MPEPSATGVWPAGGVTAVVEKPAVPGYELLDELGRGGMGSSTRPGNWRRTGWWR
jgi:hypothetical protein